MKETFCKQSLLLWRLFFKCSQDGDDDNIDGDKNDNDDANDDANGWWGTILPLLWQVPALHSPSFWDTNGVCIAQCKLWISYFGNDHQEREILQTSKRNAMMMTLAAQCKPWISYFVEPPFCPGSFEACFAGKKEKVAMESVLIVTSTVKWSKLFQVVPTDWKIIYTKWYQSPPSLRLLIQLSKFK